MITRRSALKLIAALPIQQMQHVPNIGTYQIYLSKDVKIEVFYEGEKITVDPGDIFEALKPVQPV